MSSGSRPLWFMAPQFIWPVILCFISLRPAGSKSNSIWWGISLHLHLIPVGSRAGRPGIGLKLHPPPSSPHRPVSPEALLPELTPCHRDDVICVQPYHCLDELRGNTPQLKWDLRPWTSGLVLLLLAVVLAVSVLLTVVIMVSLAVFCFVTWCQEGYGIYGQDHYVMI